ncbi:hypothetical protein HPB49_007798 [Dermacentor silvarum]|uniref:Uncharacterized protein n=1 Tax=Dermacentor silvarum TaxID=543639 RepID=A0ACB8CQC1_DERSI|nr:hypothetical protein HPB49_007798 [Dermacentor silvarum]
MVYCSCVPFCKSSGRRSRISFHEFAITEIRHEWLKKISRHEEGEVVSSLIEQHLHAEVKLHSKESDAVHGLMDLGGAEVDFGLEEELATHLLCFVFVGLSPHYRRAGQELELTCVMLEHNHDTTSDMFASYPECRKLNDNVAKLVHPLLEMTARPSLIVQKLKEDTEDAKNPPDRSRGGHEEDTEGMDCRDTEPQASKPMTTGPSSSYSGGGPTRTLNAGEEDWQTVSLRSAPCLPRLVGFLLPLRRSAVPLAARRFTGAVATRDAQGVFLDSGGAPAVLRTKFFRRKIVSFHYNNHSLCHDEAGVAPCPANAG